MFEKAVTLILKHEAGYVNDPQDPGGETKFGISKKQYPTLDIKKLTIEDAKAIYYRDYWLKCRCDELTYPIALLVFDTAVNLGVGTAIKLLQASCAVPTDGIFGPQTMHKVKAMEDTFLAMAFCALRVEKYQSLSTYKRFGYGWVRRVFETVIMAFKK